MAEGSKKDLYATLGVPRDADADAIRKAYRKLARRHHPDVNPGDAEAEARFKAISEAYSVLGDEDKRKLYDEFGEISMDSGFDPEAARRAREAFGQRFGGGGFGEGVRFEHGGPEFGGSGGEAFEFGNLDDLLGNLFERRGWREGSVRGRGPDLEAELELDFLDAARGAERRLTIGRPMADGSVRTETVTVRIPAGVSDGGRIRLRGKGGEGIGGGPPGDLHARIRVRPHPIFRRSGRDLEFDLPLSVREATLGTQVEVPTLEGRVTLTVPPGSDSGRKLRLRGKGVPDPGGGSPGDLYAIVQIRVPRKLEGEARERLEAFDELDPGELRKELS